MWGHHEGKSMDPLEINNQPTRSSVHLQLKMWRVVLVLFQTLDSVPVLAATQSAIPANAVR
jgi:hypothetical protein